MRLTVRFPQNSLLKKSKTLQRTYTSFSVRRASKTKRLAFSTSLMGAGIAGRVALQGIPSVEPIIALAVMAGFFLGWRQGAYVGAAGFFLSNFLVWGFQGPWTIAQVAGAGLAGASPAIMGKISKSRYSALFSLGLGVLFFELAVNMGTTWFWLFGPASLITALPFGIVHAASTLSFGGLIWKMRKRIEKLNLEDIYEIKIRGFRYSPSNDGGGRIVFCEYGRRFGRRPYGLYDRGSDIRIAGQDI